MDTATLKIELPASNVEFLEKYAQTQESSISKIINNYFQAST